MIKGKKYSRRKLRKIQNAAMIGLSVALVAAIVGGTIYSKHQEDKVTKTVEEYKVTLEKEKQEAKAKETEKALDSSKKDKEEDEKSDKVQ